MTFEGMLATMELRLDNVGRNLLEKRKERRERTPGP
jgi:hypothetical protein